MWKSSYSISSGSLPNHLTPLPVSKGDTLQRKAYLFGHYSELMVTGKGRNVNRPVN